MSQKPSCPERQGICLYKEIHYQQANTDSAFLWISRCLLGIGDFSLHNNPSNTGYEHDYVDIFKRKGYHAKLIFSLAFSYDNNDH